MLLLSLLLACNRDSCPLTVDTPVDETWSAGEPVPVTASAPGTQLVLTVDGQQVASGTETLTLDWDPADAAEGWHEFVFSGEGCSSTVTRRVGVDRVSPVVGLETTVEGSSLTFVVDATDVQGLVGVEALLDGVAVTSPVDLSDGMHTLEGRAWDAAGNVGTASAEVYRSALTVRFDSPADGAIIWGPVSVQAQASYFTAIARLSVTLDGMELGGVEGDMLTTDWDTCSEDPGSHTLEAAAEAKDGSTATATITVSVTPPDIDGDGADACSDCDDSDPELFPGGVEICGDGIDQGCDGLAVGCGPDGELDPSGDVSYEGMVAGPDNDSWVVVADFDLDGMSEVAIGCPNEGSAAEGWEGAVRIAPTASSGLVDLDEAVLHDGSVRYGAPGQALAAGDLQGDEALELVVSEPGLNPSPRGSVYILADGELLRDTPLADVAIRLDGLGENDGIADRLSVTDMDGDGQAVFVAGAEEASRGEGAVFVVPGPVDSSSVFSDDLAIVGSREVSYVGGSLCTGDYDGDGYQDALIGISEGEVAAWLVTGPITGTVELGDQPDHLRRAAVDDHGGSFMGCGDIDQDGIADPMIGAIRAQSGGSMSGAAYFVKGPLAGASELWAADVIVRGDEESMYVGYSIATGDFDLDGLGDVVVGAPRAGSFAGELFFFADIFGGSADIVYPDAHVEGGRVGYGLFVGDATGDGIDDVLVPTAEPTTNTGGSGGSVRVHAGGGAF